MGTLKARGIVLKEYISGEADKTLIVLTFEYGKLRLSARGAQKPKSKFHASAQYFTLSDFVIFAGNGFYSVNEAQSVYKFGKIAENYNTICYASYLMELTEKTVLEGETVDEILNLLLYAFKSMEKGVMDLKLLRAVYEFKFMQLCGFSPVLDSCFSCGETENLVFGGYGLSCANCVSGKHTDISETAVYALNYILEKDVKEVFSFKLNGEAQEKLIKASEVFLAAHSGIYLKSAEFLE
ncbi:MAG: DNA repair protein RecO [Clostridiales bacterium]|nr:DNA repair protein RecO [Clostridiales bacterium]